MHLPSKCLQCDVVVIQVYCEAESGRSVMLDAGKRCDSGPCLTCWTWVSWWRAVNHYCLILQSTPQSKSEFLIFCCNSSSTNPSESPSVCHACYSCTETLKCYSPWTTWNTWPTWSTKVAASRSSNFLDYIFIFLLSSIVSPVVSSISQDVWSLVSNQVWNCISLKNENFV